VRVTARENRPVRAYIALRGPHPPEVEQVDWKILATTFGLIFVAELGDKTQLTTMMLAAQSRAPLAVFAGATGALVLTSLIGVAVGGVITSLVPARCVQVAAGAVFVVIGLLLISGRV